MTRPYCGYLTDPHRLVAFRSATEPTRESHGHRFLAVIGPFRTMRAARVMARYGPGNPHLQSVSDAERLTRLGILSPD